MSIERLYIQSKAVNFRFSTVSAAFSIIYPGKEKPYKLFVANCKFSMLLFEDSLEPS